MYFQIKNFFKKLTGFTLYRKNTPWGLNIYNDIRRINPSWSPNIIFDVGANVGQTAFAFHEAWPNAKIFSFEPVKNTFNILKQSVDGFSCIEPIPLALGSIAGEQTIKIFSDSLLASLDSRVSPKPDSKLEVIQVSTVQEFCLSRSIDHISLLKIDTEGYDIEVLKGAGNLLRAGNIDFILAEFSDTTNEQMGKISLTDIGNFLRDYDMICVGIYNQDCWLQMRLFYGNALFMRTSHL